MSELRPDGPKSNDKELYSPQSTVAEVPHRLQLSTHGLREAYPSKTSSSRTMAMAESPQLYPGGGSPSA